MATIEDEKVAQVSKFYHEDELSMQEIADTFGVSLDAVVYFMRKHNIQRRTQGEVNKKRFIEKEPSFSITGTEKELEAIGAMLYWGEGYKTKKSNGVDFANSDPEMIKMFLVFLRSRYELDEKKFRILLYCYSDQDVKKLIKFWSSLTGIPKTQFTKPYVREDFRKNSRKMQHGLVHIRYYDKKLWKDILNLIESYKDKYASVVS